MNDRRKVKMAMMAASALVAASAALAPAHASEFDPAAHPITVEAPVIAHAADHADQKAQSPAKKAGLIAVAIGALAGLVKLLGAKRIFRAVKETAVETARVSGKAAGYAAGVVGRAFASPLRFATLMAGLALFALTGVGLYDIEWIGGLVAGAAMTGVAAYSGLKMRMALQPKRVKPRTDDLR